MKSSVREFALACMDPTGEISVIAEPPKEYRCVDCKNWFPRFFCEFVQFEDTAVYCVPCYDL